MTQVFADTLMALSLCMMFWLATQVVTCLSKGDRCWLTQFVGLLAVSGVALNAHWMHTRPPVGAMVDILWSLWESGVVLVLGLYIGRRRCGLCKGDRHV